MKIRLARKILKSTGHMGARHCRYTSAQIRTAWHRKGRWLRAQGWIGVGWSTRIRAEA